MSGPWEGKQGGGFLCREEEKKKYTHQPLRGRCVRPPPRRFSHFCESIAGGCGRTSPPSGSGFNAARSNSDRQPHWFVLLLRHFLSPFSQTPHHHPHPSHHVSYTHAPPPPTPPPLGLNSHTALWKNFMCVKVTAVSSHSVGNRSMDPLVEHIVKIETLRWRVRDSCTLRSHLIHFLCHTLFFFFFCIPDSSETAWADWLFNKISRKQFYWPSVDSLFVGLFGGWGQCEGGGVWRCFIRGWMF